MVYNSKIVALAENPEHIGSMDEMDPNVGVGQDGAPACGDLLKVYIKVDNQDVIEDVKFKIFGCGSAIASSEFMARTLIGKSLSSVLTKSSPENRINENNKENLGVNSLDQNNDPIDKTNKSNTESLDLENLNSYIANELKLPPVKFHCSVLAKDAITSAIENLKKKRGFC